MSLAHLLKVFIISASPIAELRLALPLALYDYGMPWHLALPLSLLGNLLPVPFLLLLLEPLSRLAARVGLLERALNWIFRHTRRRGRLVEKYERLGLVLFVAVPLPGSGAWTGSILAFLLGLNFWTAFLCIALGVFVAGVVVTVLSLLGWIGGLIAGVGLIVLLSLGLWKI